MDTKWKKSKGILAFASFFLGASLLAGSLLELWRIRPASWAELTETVEGAIRGDYQEGTSFREEICRKLETFLIMGSGGDFASLGVGLGGNWSVTVTQDEVQMAVPGGKWSSIQIAPRVVTDAAEPEAETSSEPELRAEAVIEEPAGSAAFYVPDAWWLGEDDWEEYLERGDYSEEEEQELRRRRRALEQQRRSLIEQYQVSLNADKNLLYAVYAGEELKYSNTEELTLLEDGRLQAPEGYNFTLYFDGSKVHVFKDGEKVDVYGDGYFDEDSLWNVPGYANVVLPDKYEGLRVYMAAAQIPRQYAQNLYGSSVARSSGDTLYWLCKYTLRQWRNAFLCLVLLALGLVLWIAGLCAGKSRKEGGRLLAAGTGRIWLEVKGLLFLGLLIMGGILIREWDSFPDALWGSVLFGGFYLLWNDWRCNRGGFWRQSLIYKVSAKLSQTFSARGKALPLSKRMLRRDRFLLGLMLSMGIFCVALTLLMARCLGGGHEVVLLIFLPACGFMLLGIFLGYENLKKNASLAADLDRLDKEVALLHEGKYFKAQGAPGGASGFASAQAAGYAGANGAGSPSGAFSGNYVPAEGDLAQILERLEDIGQGMARAVEEQMKSERMKVELIANVSHDLKTPLTSIISYVELLEQEEELPEYVKEYVRILAEKAERLKNMVQDVFMVSKAASGELPVNLEVLDYGRLLEQTLADMQEAVEKSGLIFRTELPERPVMVRADGQRLYRVFQNLIQNALQYSLEGSRVYIVLKVEGGQAAASVKNTSRQELDANLDFTERFVRGDASRSDGGSGLGLSIARSFTEACGGTFRLEIIADLFVVTVSFQAL